MKHEDENDAEKNPIRAEVEGHVARRGAPAEEAAPADVEAHVARRGSPAEPAEAAEVEAHHQKIIHDPAE